MSILRKVASVTAAPNAGDLRAIREGTDESRAGTQHAGASHISPQRGTRGDSAARERQEQLALLPNSIALLELDEGNDGTASGGGGRRTYYLAGLRSGSLALLRPNPFSLERM